MRDLGRKPLEPSLRLSDWKRPRPGNLEKAKSALTRRRIRGQLSPAWAFPFQKEWDFIKKQMRYLGRFRGENGRWRVDRWFQF